MQIKHVKGKIRLTFPGEPAASCHGVRPEFVDLTVEEAYQLCPDLGPAVRVGNKPVRTNYVKLAIEEAIAYDKESYRQRIMELKEKLRRLEAGEDPPLSMC